VDSAWVVDCEVRGVTRRRSASTLPGTDEGDSRGGRGPLEDPRDQAYHGCAVHPWHAAPQWAQRRVRIPAGPRPTGDDHRTTNFELLFDLVYIFAVTQVTGYMAREHSPRSVLQGLLILALLWWTWSAPIVAGIVIAALGVRGVLAHAEQTAPLGVFDAAALFGGFAIYLGGHLLFTQRMHNALSIPRLITICVLLAILPGAAFLPPLAGLAGLVAILMTLIAVETTRYASERRDLRSL
jgi:low temperature requirement protein LtrA